jgi:hypothetical protein
VHVDGPHNCVAGKLNPVEQVAQTSRASTVGVVHVAHSAYVPTQVVADAAITRAAIKITLIMFEDI